MKARMCCFVIRKQRDEHVRNGRPKKWIAACQNCGRACSSLSHAEVLAWADGHLRDRKRHPHPPPPVIPAPPRFVMPVISNEVAAQIGKRMREAMKATNRRLQ